MVSVTHTHAVEDEPSNKRESNKGVWENWNLGRDSARVRGGI